MAQPQFQDRVLAGPVDAVSRRLIASDGRSLSSSVRTLAFSRSASASVSLPRFEADLRLLAGASSGRRNGRVGSRLSSPPGDAPGGDASGASASYTASADGRACGALASIDETKPSTAAGTSARLARTEGTGDCRWRVRSGASAVPWNGTSPVSSSCSRQPSE